MTRTAMCYRAPHAGSQPVGSVRWGGRPLPERNGWQPVTACRVMDTDTDLGVGRAAPLNGSAAGGNTGAGGGSVVCRVPRYHQAGGAVSPMRWEARTW